MIYRLPTLLARLRASVGRTPEKADKVCVQLPDGSFVPIASVKRGRQKVEDKDRFGKVQHSIILEEYTVIVCGPVSPAAPKEK